MNVLFIVPYVPNLIRVRPYNLIRHLSARGHRVTVLTIWTDEKERESLEQLKHDCHQVHAVHLPSWRSFWNCLKAIPTSLPLQAVYSWQPALVDLAIKLSSQAECVGAFDVVHVEHLRGAQYGLKIKTQLSGSRPFLPIVWDSVDSISLLFRQAMVRSKSLFNRGLTRFELNRTERYESRLLGQFDQVMVTSTTDKGALQTLAPLGLKPVKINVLRNGVDLAYFKPPAGIAREADTIVVSGKMSYHANVAMALYLVEDIMPCVWASRPDVRVLIVGKDPPKKIQDLAQKPNVVVTGTVSDLRTYIQTATMAVAPIAYGVGIQNKVLEAMACGTPVLVTPQAISALDVQPGRDVLVAEGPSEFAEGILALLKDGQRQVELGQAGRAYVEKHHSWDNATAQLEEIYMQAIFEKSTARSWVLESVLTG